jgi:hypothetical protein
MKDGAKWACVLCRLLDYVQKNHCAKAYEAERARIQPPSH